jgi:hypothetical protein
LPSIAPPSTDAARVAITTRRRGDAPPPPTLPEFRPVTPLVTARQGRRRKWAGGGASRAFWLRKEYVHDLELDILVM